VFESVSKPFTVRALSGLDLDALDSDLKLIVLDKICQLAKACRDLHAGTTRLVLGGKPLRPTHFTPVLVTWQGMPLWAPVMQLVDRLCDSEGLFRDLPHDPVQILSIEEFERLLQLVWCNRVSMLGVLRQRAASPRGREESMEIWLHQRCPARKPGRRHPLLGQSFDELHEAVIQMLESQPEPTEGRGHTGTPDG
jgi:hypothetical protein